MVLPDRDAYRSSEVVPGSPAIVVRVYKVRAKCEAVILLPLRRLIAYRIGVPALRYSDATFDIAKDLRLNPTLDHAQDRPLLRVLCIFNLFQRLERSDIVAASTSVRLPFSS